MKQVREPNEVESVLLIGAEWFDDLPGGLNRYLRDLLAALTSHGVLARATLVGPAESSPPMVLPGGRLDSPLLARLFAMWRATAGAGRGASVVDVHFVLYAVLPVLFGRLRDLPLVVHFQGPWAQESIASGDARNWRISAKRRVERALYRKAARVIVLSSAFRRTIVETYGVVPWNVDVVPPGVDLVRFCPTPRAACRDSLGLTADAFVAVAARRLDRRMGLDVLLRAWSKVVAARPDAVLLLAGAGPERQRLEAAAATLQLSGSVRFLGTVTDRDLVGCYAAADVSVVPTIALEGFGLVVLESLACGTPAVVTDVGGLPEVVNDLDPTLVVPTDDAEALAARLLRTATGEVPSAEACRAYAERFRWDDIAARHMSIYRKATTGITSAPRTRVVYVDHCAGMSGGELALLRLLPALESIDAHVVLAADGPFANALQSQGHSVEVVPMAQHARTLGRERVRPTALPLGGALSTLGYTLRLARRLRRLKPDIVHTNSLKAAIYGGAAARLAGVPLVWHVRDRVADDYLPRPAVRLVRLLARTLPHAVIANSRTTLDTLGPLKRPAAVVSSPVQSVTYQAATVPRVGALTIGMVGRLAPWKGQHIFLEAFARAFPSGPERALVVGAALFGEAAYERELRDQATKLGIGPRVEFTGFVEDVARLLLTFDVLVHASVLPEPFGQVVVQGMAAGLPVVASRAGGPAEIIDDGIDGLLFAPGDPDALAAVLRRLSMDAALRRRLGEQGRQRAREFTPERAADQIMAVYRQLLVR